MNFYLNFRLACKSLCTAALLGCLSWGVTFASGFTYSGQCLGDPTFFSIDDPVGIDSVLWDFGDPASGGGTVPGFNVSHTFSGAGGFWVTAYCYSAGVPVNSMQLVLIQPAPQIFLGNDSILCMGDSLRLPISVNAPGSSYLWQDGSTSPTYMARRAGVFFVTVSNVCGTASAGVRLDLRLYPFVQLPPDTIICNDDRILLNVTQPGASYSWQDGNIEPNYTVDRAGKYRVRVNNECGTVADSFIVHTLPRPRFELGPDTLLCSGEQLQLSTGWFDGASYRWSTGTRTPQLLVRQAGQYIVEVRNACDSYSDSININFEYCNCKVTFANAFSPNDDGYNDQFGPIAACGFNSFRMRIYNRWGKLIFDSGDPGTGWDGKFEGRSAPEGVYVWQVEYSSDFTGTVQQNGTVLLMR